MKHLFSVLIALITFPVILQGQQVKINDLSKFDGIVTASEFNTVKRVHPVAQRAIDNREVAGEFKNVTYKLAPNVRVLSVEQKSRLKMSADGILDRSLMGGFNPDPSLIYLDMDGEFAFQAQPLDEKSLMVLRPKMSSVFEDLNIPPQEVALTLANTAVTDPAVQTSSSKSQEDYLINFVFKDYKIVLDSLGKSGCFITLNGNISLTNPKIEASYTKNNGYRILFKAGEVLNLKADMNIKIKNEQKMLLWGGYAQIPELGKCEIAIYLALTFEGNITLKVEMSHAFDLQLGVKGSTFWYAPTSFKNISDYSLFNEMSADLVLDAKAFAGVMCNANMRIFGLKLLDINFTAGLEATGKIEDNKISAEMGLRALSEWKLLHLKKTMFNKYILMLRYEKPNFAGYDITIHEACAFGDFVAGEVRKSLGGDTIPYTGPLTLLVKQSPSSQPGIYSAQTDKDGIFLAKNIPLKKGSTVSVRLPGVANASPESEATIPFSEIQLYHADYYAGIAGGSVSGGKSKWYKLATAHNTSAGAAQNSAAAGLYGGAAKFQHTSALSRSERMKRISEFMADILEYRGPVELVSQSGSRPLSGVINSLNGSYEVRNLNFIPGDLVKARINVEGFIVESDWVETDGLVVSDIETEGLQFSGTHSSTTASALSSFVLVSPLRGETNPQGSLRLIKGMNYSDPLPVAERTAVDAFPDARNAVVYFDKTVNLVQLEGNPSVSVARSGTWSKSYSLPAVSASVFKCDRPFEVVSYLFKNREVGYSFFMEPCGKTTSKGLHTMFEAMKGQKLEGIMKGIRPKKAAPKVNNFVR